MVRDACADIETAVDDVIAEGDKVALRFSITGTHTGEMLGISPTGKRVHVTGTGIFRIADGKVAENRVTFDALGMLQQLGVVPALGPAAASA